MRYKYLLQVDVNSAVTSCRYRCYPVNGMPLKKEKQKLVQCKGGFKQINKTKVLHVANSGKLPTGITHLGGQINNKLFKKGLAENYMT